jgi:anti-anti-sigma factor
LPPSEMNAGCYSSAPREEIEMTDEGPRIGVDAGTELTAATAAAVRSVVAEAMQRGRMIDLHLESVNSYDVAGLGLLIGLKRRIESAAGHLVCVNPSAPLYSGIRKLGLHRVLDIRRDLPQPRAGMRQGPPKEQASCTGIAEIGS